MKKAVILFFSFLLLVGVILVVWFGIFGRDNESRIVLEVGRERIYQKDYTYELKNTPTLVNVDQKMFVYDKLSRDSIILQEASKKGLVQLDSDIFDSDKKDYPARLNATRSAEELLVKSSQDIEGTIIALWFFNNDVTGPDGYEASKKVTYDKIVALQKRVKSGQLTPEAAALEIKEDSTLAAIDPAYKANAIYHFKARDDERIVFDDRFNEVIQQLPEGSVSDVYTLKAPTGAGNLAPKEALHAFFVRDRSKDNLETGISTDINTWYQSVKNQYEIKKR